MESPSSIPSVLSLPQKTPWGWHVVYQPGYKTPNVFNLHERGMFADRAESRFSQCECWCGSKSWSGCG